MKLFMNIGSSQKMSLTGAVLVYEAANAVFATWHPAMTSEHGPPALGAADPPNVLVRTGELIVWWTPAQHRTLFFADHSEASRVLNGKRYPIPPLVFRVSDSALAVRALEKSERPTAKTGLKTAPFWNVNEAGEVCLGTMRVPDGRGVEAMTGWELGFFQSEFTHASGAARLTNYPGGFLALCQHVSGRRKPFPVEYLTDARETLQQFVERR
jgi:PRTRC genetic system protein B